GCVAYALFGEGDAALFVGRSVRVRQRLRALLTGERRSSKEMRLAQQVRRVEWRETGNELGAMLAEAQWIAQLRPSYNRRPAADTARAGGVPWPFEGAVAFEAHGERRLFHVIDGWRYLGAAESLDAAVRLVADGAGGAFEPFTHRLLQTHLARGLQVIPLTALTPAD
ncbi:MAG: DNA polymerase III subunit epsilon, partial [Burkholderia sp.]|nr:DNA polymerase III subunit epsilon [Burkholderia sp.]